MLRTAASLADGGVQVVAFPRMGELPHFNPDDDHEPLPAAAAALREGIGAADALLICTPEYAGALPGSFKNLLDWTIGGGEIHGKRVAWINASGPAAPTGGADAHDSLRKVLRYAGAAIVEDACVRVPVVRDAVGSDGFVADPAARAVIAAAVRALVA